jgi:hypothetical protein
MHNDTTVFVGLDIHKDSITTACVGNEMAHMRRAPADVSRSAATACYTPANAS